LIKLAACLSVVQCKLSVVSYRLCCIVYVRKQTVPLHRLCLYFDVRLLYYVIVQCVRLCAVMCVV